MALAVVVAIPAKAAAGTFNVKNCIDEAPTFSVAASHLGGSRVEALDCNDPGSTGLLQLNGRSGHSDEGEYGAWRWEAKPGTAIVAATIKAKLRNASGWAAQLIAARPGDSPLVFGSAPASGDFDVYNLYEGQVGESGASHLDAQLKCYRAGGCDLDALGGATSRPDNVLLTVSDGTAPSTAASGQLLSSGSNWHRGTEAVSLLSGDEGSGVSRLTIAIDDAAPVALTALSCPGDRGNYAITLQPCPAAVSRNLSVSTSLIGDGSHQVRFCAGDYGLPRPNYGCSSPHTVRVDNTPPLQPESLEVAGGAETWHPDNSFDLSWTNPPQSAAPIAAMHRRILDSAGSVVSSDVRSAGALNRLADLSVPGGPGRYTVEVWLEDAAGNQGAPARAALRFDNVRPGRADPIAPGGWLSRTELPYTLRIAHPPNPLPESGIRGYAIAVDQAASTDPCAAPDRCSYAETDLKGGIGGDSLPVADLPEGTSFVHAVAVSGSGKKSATVGRATIRADKTDPVTTLGGAPPGWNRGPVAITATAADALSGMDAVDGSDDPLTAIRVDGGVATTSVGDSVSTAVSGDGVHSIAYYARDLAGNVNDGGSSHGRPNRPPGSAVVRIDRTEPGIAFLNNQNPDDPELIRAQLSDGLSGPDPSSGRILVRRVGSTGRFEPLASETVDETVRARWDSDAYPAGEYEFRATGSDLAGNTVTTGRRANGTEMVLPNPIKVPTALRAGFGGKVLFEKRCHRSRHGRRCHRREVRGFNRRPRSWLLPYGRGPLFSGRLSAGVDSPLSGMPVRVTERFRPGSRRPTRAITLKTDRVGIFSLRLSPGPSRRIEAHFRGTRTLTASSSRAARMRIRSGVRLRASSKEAVVGGRPLVLSGRVKSRGALIPADGKLIELQYRLRSIPWTEFRTVSTDRRGRYRLGYRFTDPGSRGIRFEFRAFAPPQSTWPFAAAASPPVVVRGR